MSKELMFKGDVPMSVVSKVLFVPDTDIPLAVITGAVAKATGCGEIGINPIMKIDDDYYLLPEDYVLKKIFNDIDGDLFEEVLYIAGKCTISEQQFNLNNAYVIDLGDNLVALEPRTRELIVRYIKRANDLANRDKMYDTNLVVFEYVNNGIEVQKDGDNGYYIDYTITNLDAIKFNNI